MLHKSAWRPYEPRFGFPVFKGIRTYVSFSIRSDYTPISFRKIPAAARASLKQGIYGMSDFVREYGTLLGTPWRFRKLKFRMLITDRQGKFLGLKRVPGVYPPGGSIDVDVKQVLDELGLPDENYIGILVMSRGRSDSFRSSPGSYSMTYVGNGTYTTYRTGGFGRTLNDPKRKQHFGFRGINPKAIANDHHLSSILLINHSSDPMYDNTVRPHSVLIRHDGSTREAPFGDITPFGGLERSLEDLFGKDVVDFLAPYGGKGTVISTCPAVTLASIHVMRARDGSSMSVEHSRPTHTYLMTNVL